MLSDFLKQHITSQAEFVQENGWGYAQVEPNHLSGQATKEVYAQLPAAADIKVLEQGQFAKYDYLNEEVNFSGAGEWMLVFNEIKLYRDHQDDCEFALKKGDYSARVYSPFGGDRAGNPDIAWKGITADGDKNIRSRYLNGTGVDAKDGSIKFDNDAQTVTFQDKNGEDVTYPFDKVIAPPDMYEIHYTEDPFKIATLAKEKMMKAGTTMVPRLIKTHVGDIYTTNCIGEKTVDLGDELSPRAADGILSKSGDGSIVWQVVKIYTMPDHQPGVKLMRIK